jgi:hypothetical protein
LPYNDNNREKLIMDPETPKDPAAGPSPEAASAQSPAAGTSLDAQPNTNPRVFTPGSSQRSQTPDPLVPTVPLSAEAPPQPADGPFTPGTVTTGGVTPPRFSRKTIKLIVGAAVLVTLGAAGYVFGYYIPNKPENVYATALKRTGIGYDRLVDYASDPELAKKYKSTEVSGKFRVDSTDFDTDGTFEAKADEKNMTFKMDVGALTSRLKAEIVAKDAENSESPDVYFKADGIKGYGSLTGIPGLDGLDKQWISVDHSLIDTATKSLSNDTAESLKLPDDATLKEAYKTLGDVSDQYLFTGSKKNGVIEMRSYVGKEKVDGKQTLHYKVGVNKANYKKFIRALASEMDKTKLNTWVKENYGKSISQSMDVEAIIKDADKLDAKDTADLWVNAGTKLVHKVRFTEKNDPKTYLELGLDYDSGDSFPFFLNFKSSGDGIFKLTATLNAKTDAITVKGALTGNPTVSGSFDLTVKPGTDNLSVTAPTGSITLTEALARLGLGDYLNLLTQSLSGTLQNSAPTGANGGYSQEELQLLQSLYNVQ